LLTNRPPKRLFFFWAAGGIGDLGLFDALSLSLDLVGFNELPTVVGLPVLVDVSVFVSLPELLGMSSMVGLGGMAVACNESAVAEFRYESFGTCADFQSGFLGELGMAACMVAEV
jgi:hypothetical protein